MAHLEQFKTLTCRDVGGACDFIAQAATEEEVMEIALDHICLAHEICDVISLDTENRWRSLIRSIWVPKWASPNREVK